MNKNLRVLVAIALIGTSLAFAGCSSDAKEEVNNTQKQEVTQDIDKKEDKEDTNVKEDVKVEKKEEVKSDELTKEENKEDKPVEEEKKSIKPVEKSDELQEKPEAPEPEVEKPEVEKPEVEKPEPPKPVEPEIEKPEPPKPEQETIAYTISKYDAAADRVFTKTFEGPKEELQKPWSVFKNLKDFGSIVSDVSLINYTVNSNNIGVINVSSGIYAGLGSGVESMMIEHLAKGFSAAFKTDGSIINVDGGAYATGHIELGIDEVIR